MSQKFMRYPRSQRKYLLDLSVENWKYIDALCGQQWVSYRELFNRIIEEHAKRNPIQDKGSQETKKVT